MQDIIKALDESRILQMMYDGETRWVEPLQMGVSTAGNEVLRAIHEGVPKMFYLTEIQPLEVGRQFTPSTHTGSDDGMITVTKSVNPMPKMDSDLQQQSLFETVNRPIRQKATNDFRNLRLF